MADDQVLIACVCDRVCACISVHPHIHVYGNTVDRGGDSTVKCAKMVLISFLLKFHSTLKENVLFFLFCITSLCLSLPISLSVYLYIYKSISSLLSDRWYLYLHYLLLVLQICSVSLMVNFLNPS